MGQKTDRNKIDTEDSAKQPMALFLLGMVVISSCALFITAFIFFQPDQLSLSDRYFPSPTVTQTGTPTNTPSVTSTSTITSTPTASSTPTRTPTPRPTRTPTSTATPNLTATQQVVLNQEVMVADLWPVVFSETFENNQNGWQIGTIENELSKIDYKMMDEKYRWDVTAHKELIEIMEINTEQVGDFYLTVDAREVVNPAVGNYGLIFRQDQEGDFYYFAITPNQEFFVSLNYKGERMDLIDPTYSQIIQPIALNHLTVIGQGSRLVFFINDQYMAEITDDHIQAGTIALAIELSKTNDQTSFVFDNLELRTP